LFCDANSAEQRRILYRTRLPFDVRVHHARQRATRHRLYLQRALMKLRIADQYRGEAIRLEPAAHAHDNTALRYFLEVAIWIIIIPLCHFGNDICQIL
jgi:hypothetical protein